VEYPTLPIKRKRVRRLTEGTHAMDAPSLRLEKSDDLVTRSIAGETIIVPIRGQVGDLDSIFTLNEVGTRIWELLDGRRDDRMIVEELGKEFAVEEEEAARDVQEFLGSLQAVGLVQPSRVGGS
jgi:hypothetical protein